MDEAQLERLASNNPGVTVPANARKSNNGASESKDGTSTSDGDRNSQIHEPPLSPTRPPTKYDVGWRRIVRNFTPSWFSVTMGTGVVGILLKAIPFQARWLYYLSILFFVLNTVLFTLAFIISTLRYTLYPAIWTVMIDDPVNSLFLGTIPMGFATLINQWVAICVPSWGSWSATFAFALWIIDSVAALAVTLSLPFLLMSRSHLQSLDRITAAQLLPVASTIVASGAGSNTASALLSSSSTARLAPGTLIASYILCGLSTPLAMTILVIYYQRLALHKLPPREVIVSCFLPLGPLGMGGYTIMSLGKVARELLPRGSSTLLKDVPVAADVLYVLGIFFALIMWSFGLAWLVFALVAIYGARPFPFNMGWWGFTFPLGVYALSTVTLGNELPSLFFRVLGTILSGVVAVLWIVVAAGTAKGAWEGKLFYAPCLKNLKDEEKVPREKAG
ncbi:MAG: hypothetical protein Q9227_008086 [Pyrenula ochraceoflavens]